jgi:curved DNA-binding protein CbpA
MTEQWELAWSDYYETLQISCNAEPEVIDAAFRKLASKYHPDRSSGDEARMKRINEAHAVLRDPAARSRYDVAYRERAASDKAAHEPRRSRGFGAHGKTESASRQHAEAEPEANGPTEPRSVNIWATLGVALIDIGARYLDARLDKRLKQPKEAGRIDASPPDISGRWVSPMGSVFSFSQQGSKFSVHGSGGGVPLNGMGQIRGMSVSIEGYSPNGGPFQAALIVSPDSRFMRGSIQDSLGRVSPVELYR